MEIVAHFLKDHPEAAGLLAGLSPEQLAGVLPTLQCEKEDYPLVASIYQRHCTAEEAVRLAAVLKKYSQQICRLTRRGLFGAEVPYLYPRTGEGDQEYDRWLQQAIEQKSRNSDEELASFFQFALNQGPAIQARLSKAPYQCPNH
jgi:hypothetical protein